MSDLLENAEMRCYFCRGIFPDDQMFGFEVITDFGMIGVYEVACRTCHKEQFEDQYPGEDGGGYLFADDGF